MKTLSVVVPLYFPTENHEEVFFRRCMRSLSEQTFRDFELILVVNGIPNYEAKINGFISRVMEWSSEFSYPIKIHHGPSPIGVSKAMNVGIRMSTGNYVALQAQDDESYPERLASQMRMLAADPSIDVLGTGMKYGVEPKFALRPGIGRSSEEITAILPSWCPMVAGSCIIKRSTLDRVNGFNESLTIDQPYEDYDLWKRIATVGGKFANLPEVLYVWHRDFSTFELYHHNRKYEEMMKA